jgi:hypothetical protein
MIRADNDQFIRQLYARLGPEEFYRRRPEWLERNPKWTSYHRLLHYLESRGLVAPIRLETRSLLPRVSPRS